LQRSRLGFAVEEGAPEGEQSVGLERHRAHDPAGFDCRLLAPGRGPHAIAGAVDDDAPGRLDRKIARIGRPAGGGADAEGESIQHGKTQDGCFHPPLPEVPSLLRGRGSRKVPFDKQHVIMTFTIVANLKHIKERIHVPA
jgi:hypothetical protein